MDGLILLGVLFLIYVLVFPVMLGFKFGNLKRRIEQLERQLQATRARPQSPAEDTRKPVGGVVEQAGMPPETARPPEPDFADADGDKAASDMPKPREPFAPAAAAQPRSFVFTKERSAALRDWLRRNWVLGIAALSIALGGIFMVQYGVEQGLLTPVMRVIGALALGVILIAAGEVIRRRYGDMEGSTRDLPSVFSGAGLITLFAGVLGARMLYGLIGAEMALIALIAVAVVAIVLGWFYGPVLAAIGIIGAVAAPFCVGGQSDTAWIFYYYFALIACAGLAVDSVKRWAWISTLVLIATAGAMYLTFTGLGADGAAHLLAAALALFLMALTIPERQLVPQQAGTSLSAALLGQRPFPEFPTRLAGPVLAFAAYIGFAVAMEADGLALSWLAVGLIMALLAACVIWLHKSPALADLALIPAAAFLLLLAAQPLQLYGALHAYHMEPEAAPRGIVTLLMICGGIGTLLGCWRMLALPQGRIMRLWALAAAIYAPMVALLLEFLWWPAEVLGAYEWALHVMALAALMMLLALRMAKAMTGEGRQLVTAFFTLAALVLIALALFLLLGDVALTIALSVMVLGAVMLDKRFDLPLLGIFVQIGVVVILYRIATGPLDQAFGAAPDLPMLVLSFGGPFFILATAYMEMAHRPSATSRILLESALWMIGSTFFIALLVYHVGAERVFNHWMQGAAAAIWFIAMAGQLYRLRIGNKFFRVVRAVLALVFGALGSLSVLTAVQLGPLQFSNNKWAEPVRGPYIFDSMMMAYVLPAAVLALVAWKFTHLPRLLRLLFTMAASGLGGFYIALEIRRFWHGNDLSAPVILQPELYSYTLAMLMVSVILLLLAFARRSVELRKLAMAGVALTVAKVFLVDMAGLTGLIRVASFIGLGLSLVGLTWLSRAMAARWDQGRGIEGPDPNAP